ncbi:hypothetical protein [Rhizobium sp. BR 314]|uniref:hypothetical protein n=1 Tax=Rhizobium sp. BR 314 TaxID=3040013 RepID=UPI0039BF719A
MLSPEEFTVGTFGSAQPLSLILPRTQYEATVLIAHINKAPAAIFLSGLHAFQYFESAGNDSWKGLIIPNVRVEVDETSVFDPNQISIPLGTLIRIDTRLTIWAKGERSFDASTSATLCDDLPSTGEFRAAFSRWQIVIGEGQEKRVLWQKSDESND